jgi:hypothetical protein
VALDVDGTLLDANHRVSDRTARAITEVRRRNIVVAIATGRPVELIGAPGDHADWIIGSNGATVVHAETRRVILDLTVSVEEARSLAALIRAAVAGVGFSVISEHDAVHEAGFERIVPSGVAAGRLVADALAHDGVAGERVRAWAAFHAALSIDELAARIDAVVGPRLVARSLGFGAAEITEPSITKATALQSLVDHLGFGAESVWAFGDGANDHEMLEWAGRGHAMGNADPLTKAKADLVIGSNLEHGVALALEALVGSL